MIFLNSENGYTCNIHGFCKQYKAKIIPADGNVMTWTFVMFDIRFLYLLGLYLCDVGRTSHNLGVMSLLSMTGLVSFKGEACFWSDWRKLSMWSRSSVERQI